MNTPKLTAPPVKVPQPLRSPRNPFYELDTLADFNNKSSFAAWSFVEKSMLVLTLIFVLLLFLHACCGYVDDSSHDRPWYGGLFWNLLGYATVIVPGAILIRLVKNSNFNEKAGNLILISS